MQNNDGSYRILNGDAMDLIPTLVPNSIQTVITSPPYWQARKYDGNTKTNFGACLGEEFSPEAYVEHVVTILDEVRHVLRPDGTMWVNIGDKYATTKFNSWGIKPKDLMGLPWRIAMKLQHLGWYLRSDVIWSKPNPQPSSAKDRPLLSHEHLFMFSVSGHYYYDFDAVSIPVVCTNRAWSKNNKSRRKNRSSNSFSIDCARQEAAYQRQRSLMRQGKIPQKGINSVWRVPTSQSRDYHFATYPQKLIRPCVLACSGKEAPHNVVLDPFMGSGTTGVLAVSEGRQFIGIDMSALYCKMAKVKIANQAKNYHDTIQSNQALKTLFI